MQTVQCKTASSHIWVAVAKNFTFLTLMRLVIWHNRPRWRNGRLKAGLWLEYMARKLISVTLQASLTLKFEISSRLTFSSIYHTCGSLPFVFFCGSSLSVLNYASNRRICHTLYILVVALSVKNFFFRIWLIRSSNKVHYNLKLKTMK